MYNFIRDRFPSSFQNVQLGNLNSFFQLDPQFGIDLNLIEVTALHYYRELYFL